MRFPHGVIGIDFGQRFWRIGELIIVEKRVEQWQGVLAESTATLTSAPSPANAGGVKSVHLASALGAAAGWGTVLILNVLWQLFSSHHVVDLLPMLFYMTPFVVVGWALFVALPLDWLSRYRWFRHARYAWLSWGAIGIIAFLVLVWSWMGRSALEILWVPFLVGAIGGEVMALLWRCPTAARP